MSRVKVVNYQVRSMSDPDVPETIKLDLLNLAKRSEQRQPLTGPRVIVPERDATMRAFLVSTVTTSGSTGTDYNSVTITRNGQPGAVRTIATYDGAAANEITAYQLYDMGAVSVDRGDLLVPSVTPTGSPATSLSESDFTLLCEWSE